MMMSMSGEMLILVLLVITALGFDFTNGFHDTGNAMATSIATGALKPKMAVTLAAILNLVGAFLSVEVAATITKDVLKIQETTGEHTGELVAGLDAQKALLIIFAGLIGGILLRLEYNIAEALVTDISQTAVSFTEVSLLPLLARGERDV